MWVSVNMAFKLTYTDGQESDYDDDTKWEVDGGVLKLGRQDGDWSVLVSPGHWATLELGKQATKDKKDTKDTKDKKDEDSDKKDEDSDKKDDKDDDDED
jgi:hypothetical protein